MVVVLLQTPLPACETGSARHHGFPIMKRIHNGPLNDDELRPQLEARDVIVFVGKLLGSRDIERQVERLGFGDLYVVSATQKAQCAESKISLKPEAHSS